jgi:hypothetical protein
MLKIYFFKRSLILYHKQAKVLDKTEYSPWLAKSAVYFEAGLMRFFKEALIKSVLHQASLINGGKAGNTAY